MNTTQDDNMKLWNSVETTDPEFTKRVNQRGGFTAIEAQYQLREATRLWGPYGGQWGVKDCRYNVIEIQGNPQCELALYAVFYYPGGEFPLATDIAYKPGNDSHKKLLTDLTTKALSKLGFNADVFMGRFDGNKYTGNETAQPPKASTPPSNAGQGDDVI